MSEIYGLKLEYTDFHVSFKPSRYIILEKSDNGCYLNCFDNGSVYIVDISDKVDEICDRMNKMNINDWDNKVFDEPMSFFSGFDWTLHIQADNISVNCKGIHNFPPKWSELNSILNDVGITMLNKP